MRAVCHSLPIRKAFAYSINRDESRAFADTMSRELAISVEPVDAIAPCDVLLTCTPAKRPVVTLAGGDRVERDQEIPVPAGPGVQPPGAVSAVAGVRTR